MTARAWATLLILAGLATAQLTGAADALVDRGQAATRIAVAGIQDEVGQMLSPRSAVIEDLTAEIDRLSE